MQRILHPTIYLKDRHHDIDIHVYDACSRLWAAGIETAYSCQGGPKFGKNGKIVQHKASVVVHRKDAKKALKVLKEFNPKLSDNLMFMRISIKFDATEAAKKIPLIVEHTKITTQLIK